MSVWWRDHADHHMAVLFSAEACPFGRAKGEENACTGGGPLPYDPPPEGVFVDVHPKRSSA